MYWESPENAQSHIQPLDVSPGLLLLMLSSVISEKLEVLQILQVWSAEQVANRLRTQQLRVIGDCSAERGAACGGEGHSRGVGAELAAEGVAFVRGDLRLRDELSHLIADAPGKVPHVTVSLRRKNNNAEIHEALDDLVPSFEPSFGRFEN